MTEEQKKARKGIVRLAVGFGILGGMLAVFGVYFLFIGNESRSWPSVEGSVVRPEVNTSVSRQPNSASGTGSTTIEYYVSVLYQYDVGGESYEGDRYSLGEGNRVSEFFDERAEAAVKASRLYSAGEAITVYYDPDEPSSAVLVPGWNWGTFVPLILGIVFGGFGVLIYYFVEPPAPPVEE